MSEQTLLTGICAQLGAQRLPRWRELPDIELYMDQVLALVGRYLGAYPGFDEKGLTASMVNNYVKAGALPSPQRKRYTRSHLARLLVICLLKASLPIAAIRELMADALEERSEEDFYDGFCAEFERIGAAVSDAYAGDAGATADSALLQAALRAQAEQALALKLAAAVLQKTAEDDS